MSSSANIVKFFFAFSTAHLVLWSMGPSIGFSTPHLDIVENLIWGREWVMGSIKHPPLQGWLTEIAFLFGGVPGIYIFSQVCTVATSYALFLFGRSFDNSYSGLISGIIFLLSFYGTIGSTELNANVISMPFWAFAGFFLWRILSQSPQKDRFSDWLGLSISIALAFYAKYSVMFLLFGLFCAVLIHPSRAWIFKSLKFYFATVVTVILCLPNLIWLFNNDFQPLHYAAGRGLPLIGLERITSPLNFFAGVGLAFVLPVLLMILSGARFAPKKSSDYRFLFVLSFAPLFAMMLLSAILGFGLKTMWGSSAAVFLPLLVATNVCSMIKWNRPRIGLVLAGLFLFLLPISSAIYSQYSATTTSPQRTAWNGKELTEAALKSWERIYRKPPSIVIGPAWEAGLVALFSPTRPSVLVDGDFKKSPWIKKEKLASEGALVVWMGAQKPYKSLELMHGVGSMPIWHKGKKTLFNWGVLPPHNL